MTIENKTEEAQLPNNHFITMLQNHREGYTIQELSEHLQSVVQAVRQTGKAGKLTLTIQVKPASKGAGNAVTVSDEIKTKLPELERENSIFFTDDDYSLHRQDPRQRTLNLKVVETAKKDEPLKEVASK